MVIGPTRREVLEGHNVRKVGVGEGDLTQIGNIRVNWKTRCEDVGFQFGTYQVELQPGMGVPLHQHPFPESFYVLQGELDFVFLGEQEVEQFLRATSGETVIAPMNAPHGVFNRSDRPAIFLGVSTYHHELTLTKGGRFVSASDPIPTAPDMQDFARFESVARRYQGFMVQTQAK